MEGTGETDSPAEEDRFEPSVPLTGYAGLFRERVRCQKVERVVSNRCSILAGLTVRIRIPPSNAADNGPTSSNRSPPASIGKREHRDRRLVGEREEYEPAGAVRPNGAAFIIRKEDAAGQVVAASSPEPKSRLQRPTPGASAAQEPMVCGLVWGFFCQVVFWFVAGSLFGAERPFLVPSPAIRFAERAERCQGTEMLA